MNTTDTAAPSDAAITACALMIKGICLTKHRDAWASLIEARIRFMLASQDPLPDTEDGQCAHCGNIAPTAEQAEGVRVLTADDADMVWPDDDGESMFHTIDDAVDCVVDMNWPDTAPLEVEFQIAKRIPNAKVRIFNITENGHEWEVLAATAQSDAEGKS